MPVKENKTKKDEKKETITYPSFDDVAKEFEKTHAFIERDGVYIAELDDDIQILGYEKLMKMYKHITSKRKGFQGVKFISQWANSNDKIRKFYSMSSYPPPLICPPNVYNTWLPFFAYKLPKLSKNEKKVNKLHLFRHQLFYLCNEQMDLFEYMEK